MKTLSDKARHIKKSPCWPNNYFDTSSVYLPNDWSALWCRFGIWLLTDDTFGAERFASPQNRQLITEITQLCRDGNQNRRHWLSAANRALRAADTAYLDSDEECFSAAAATYSFTRARLTEDQFWASATCAACAETTARGWSAYARLFSADAVYRRIRMQSLEAQKQAISCLTHEGQRWVA